jgi:hypothetical protein
MAMLKRWRAEPWRPTTVQEEAALRRADPLIGARGRTRIDGVAELRTVEAGEVRQYLVRPDGTAKLVESRPASLLDRRLDVVRPVVGWLMAAAVVWLMVSQAVSFLRGTVGYTAGLVFVCLIGLFVSEVVMNGEIEAAGEQWERVGGADE